MNKREKRLVTYTVILTCLVIMTILILHNAVTHYHLWRGYQQEIKSSELKNIEEWMTPHTILRHFNISRTGLFNELNISDSKKSLRTPLKDICKKQKTNCSLIIENLNNIKENGS